MAASIHPVVDPLIERLYQGHLHFQSLCTAHNLIPQMPWEVQYAKLTGLSLDQFRFTVALFASVGVAAGVRLFRNPTVRHLYALVSGLLLVYYPFGSGIIHVAPMAVAAYLAMMLAPRKCGTIAWATVFPYLVYLHVVNASGASWKEGLLDFTGGAMIVVLKLISMCMCRQDSFRKNKEDLTDYQATHQLPRLPNLLEYASYVFGLGNLLCGPWIEFTEYKEFMELKGVFDPSAARPMPGTLLPGLFFLAEGLLHMGTYLALTLNGWHMDHYHSPWFYAQPLYIKCGAIIVIGLVYQLRYYFSWKITEAAYTFAGLNFSGWRDDAEVAKVTKGMILPGLRPNGGKAKWGRCANCSFLGVQLADSARLVPFNWNAATGTFLRRYVYERVTPKGRKPGFASLLFTQLVSAVWHGLYAGYAMFFTGTAMWIYFSQIIYKAESYLPPAVAGSLPLRIVKVAWTTFVLNYMAVAFQLLDFDTSMTAYGSLNFFPYILMLVVNVLGSFLKAKRPPKPKAAAPTASANGTAANGTTANGTASKHE